MPRLLASLFLVLASSFSLANEAKLPLAAGERKKVTVIPHGAAVDGIQRSDIAQAVGDSISSFLIKTGTYRVFDATAEGPRPPRRKKNVSYAGAAPENGSLSQPPAAPAGTDFIFAHSLVGEAGVHRLTLKKIDAETSEVVAMEEKSTSGGLEALLAGIPALMHQLEARSRREVAFPQSQSPAEIRETIRPARLVQVAAPPSSDASPGVRAFAEAGSHTPSEYGGVPLASIPKALVYQPLGAIEWINDTWKFCIIQPQAGHRFAINQALDVLYDEDGRPYGSLKVDALDSGKVVAGYGRTPKHHPLFRGDVVYGWAPPLR